MISINIYVILETSGYVEYSKVPGNTQPELNRELSTQLDKVADLVYYRVCGPLISEYKCAGKQCRRMVLILATTFQHT